MGWENAKHITKRKTQQEQTTSNHLSWGASHRMQAVVSRDSPISLFSVIMRTMNVQISVAYNQPSIHLSTTVNTLNVWSRSIRLQPLSRCNNFYFFFKACKRKENVFFFCFYLIFSSHAELCPIGIYMSIPSCFLFFRIIYKNITLCAVINVLIQLFIIGTRHWDDMISDSDWNPIRLSQITWWTHPLLCLSDD